MINNSEYSLSKVISREEKEKYVLNALSCVIFIYNYDSLNNRNMFDKLIIRRLCHCENIRVYFPGIKQMEPH